MVWRAGGEWETLVMRSNDTNLRRACETKFQTEIKSKLNQLWQIEVMTQGLNVLLITFRHRYARHPNILGQFYIVTEVMPMFEAIENDKYFKFLELKYNHCVIRLRTRSFSLSVTFQLIKELEKLFLLGNSSLNFSKSLIYS